MARALAPPWTMKRPLFAKKSGTAAQSTGSKRPRHWFFGPLTWRKKISTAAPANSVRRHLSKQPRSPSDQSLVANVADVDAFTLSSHLARKSVERAGIFNTWKIFGNLFPSSVSATTRGVDIARQTRAKTRHFLLISGPSPPKVRAERPCWKRSIRLKY